MRRRARPTTLSPTSIRRSRSIPKDLLAYNNRGLAYRNKGETDAAINNYDQAICISPDFALADYNRGNADYDKRDYYCAITDYNQAIKINPSYALAYYDRGVVYYDRHEDEKAVADLNKAIELDGKDALAYDNRGLTFRAMGDMDKSLADFDQSIKLDPKICCRYYNRGLAFAIRAIRSAQSPTSASRSRWTRAMRAGVLQPRPGLLDPHHREKALADYEQAIRINLGHAPADQQSRSRQLRTPRSTTAPSPT